MTDFKITKKYSASGSLTRRILVVVIFLLVIPLFLQNLFLYHQEYEQKLADVEGDIKLLASERAHLIEETAQMEWDFLERNGDGRGGQKIPLPQGVSGRFVLMNKNRTALLAGIVDSKTTALVIPIPLKILGADIPRAYPFRVALIDKHQQVVWENRGWEEDEVVSALEPIENTGFHLQLGVEKSLIQGVHLQSYYFRFATLVLFVGGIGGSIVYLFTRRISKPLANLCKTMGRVSEGALHARYTKDWMGFEINDLGLQFNDTLDSLLKSMEEAEKEKIGREKLVAELHIGREIQGSLLPIYGPEIAGIDMAAGYLGAQEVNGDFYDVFPMENGNLFIAICDTAGKGIPACLFSLGLRSILRSLATTIDDLGQLAVKANDLYLIDAHQTAMFSTAWLGIYNPKEKELVYCSQGHPPAFLVRKEKCQELWTSGIALGAEKVDVITTNRVNLKKGDLLALYTDGVIEAHNRENELFGKERLHQMLLAASDETAHQIKTQVLKEIVSFSDGAPQHDDITFLAIRITR